MNITQSAVGDKRGLWTTVLAAAILLGWDTTAGVLLIWIWAVVGRLDSDQTADRANREHRRRCWHRRAIPCAGIDLTVR